MEEPDQEQIEPIQLTDISAGSADKVEAQMSRNLPQEAMDFVPGIAQDPRPFTQDSADQNNIGDDGTGIQNMEFPPPFLGVPKASKQTSASSFLPTPEIGQGTRQSIMTQQTLPENIYVEPVPIVGNIGSLESQPWMQPSDVSPPSPPAPSSEKEEVINTEEAPECCEKSPTCTRGYGHSGICLDVSERKRASNENRGKEVVASRRARVPRALSAPIKKTGGLELPTPGGPILSCQKNPSFCVRPYKHTGWCTRNKGGKHGKSSNTTRPRPELLRERARPRRQRKITSASDSEEKKKEVEEKGKEKPKPKKRKVGKGSSMPMVRKQKFIGLKNQGATCYINCLVQSLFHLPKVRELIDTLPLTDKSKQQPSTSISKALQKVFRGLLTAVKSVPTTALTKALGSPDINEQQDVHEYLGMVLNRLETEVEGTEASKVLKKLFIGKIQKLISCHAIGHQISSTEECSQLSLVVKGCHGLRDSLRQYCRAEQLTGDNRYRVEGHGLQDAAKEYKFVSLPPILTLCLRRFEYDRNTKTVAKVHQRFEFPTCIDLAEFLPPPEDNPQQEAEADQKTENGGKCAEAMEQKADNATGNLRKPDAMSPPTQTAGSNSELANYDGAEASVKEGSREGGPESQGTRQKRLAATNALGEQEKAGGAQKGKDGEARNSKNAKKSSKAKKKREAVAASTETSSITAEEIEHHPEWKKQARSLYLLHSIFVHSGSAQRGHYNVYIRPNPVMKRQRKNANAGSKSKKRKPRRQKDRSSASMGGGDEEKKEGGDGGEGENTEEFEWKDSGDWYCFDDETVQVLKDADVKGAFGRQKTNPKKAASSPIEASSSSTNGGNDGSASTVATTNPTPGTMNNDTSGTNTSRKRGSVRGSMRAESDVDRPLSQLSAGSLDVDSQKLPKILPEETATGMGNYLEGGTQRLAARASEMHSSPAYAGGAESASGARSASISGSAPSVSTENVPAAFAENSADEDGTLEAALAGLHETSESMEARTLMQAAIQDHANLAPLSQGNEWKDRGVLQRGGEGGGEDGRAVTAPSNAAGTSSASGNAQKTSTTITTAPVATKKAKKGPPRNSKCAYMLIYVRVSEALYKPKLSPETLRKVQEMEKKKRELNAKEREMQEAGKIFTMQSDNEQPPICDGCNYPKRKKGFINGHRNWSCHICRENKKRHKEGIPLLTREEEFKLAMLKPPIKKRKAGVNTTSTSTTNGSSAKREKVSQRGGESNLGAVKATKAKGKTAKNDDRDEDTTPEAPRPELPEPYDLFLCDRFVEASLNPSHRLSTLESRIKTEWTNLPKNDKQRYIDKVEKAKTWTVDKQIKWLEKFKEKRSTMQQETFHQRKPNTLSFKAPLLSPTSWSSGKSGSKRSEVTRSTRFSKEELNEIHSLREQIRVYTGQPLRGSYSQNIQWLKKKLASLRRAAFHPSTLVSASKSVASPKDTEVRIPKDVQHHHHHQKTSQASFDDTNPGTAKKKEEGETEGATIKRHASATHDRLVERVRICHDDDADTEGDEDDILCILPEKPAALPLPPSNPADESMNSAPAQTFAQGRNGKEEEVEEGQMETGEEPSLNGGRASDRGTEGEEKGANNEDAGEPQLGMRERETEQEGHETGKDRSMHKGDTTEANANGCGYEEEADEDDGDDDDDDDGDDDNDEDYDDSKHGRNGKIKIGTTKTRRRKGSSSSGQSDQKLTEANSTSSAKASNKNNKAAKANRGGLKKGTRLSAKRKRRIKEMRAECGYPVKFRTAFILFRQQKSSWLIKNCPSSLTLNQFVKQVWQDDEEIQSEFALKAVADRKRWETEIEEFKTKKPEQYLRLKDWRRCDLANELDEDGEKSKATSDTDTILMDDEDSDHDEEEDSEVSEAISEVMDLTKKDRILRKWERSEKQMGSEYDRVQKAIRESMALASKEAKEEEKEKDWEEEEGTGDAESEGKRLTRRRRSQKRKGSSNGRLDAEPSLNLSRHRRARLIIENVEEAARLVPLTEKVPSNLDSLPSRSSKRRLRKKAKATHEQKGSQKQKPSSSRNSRTSAIILEDKKGRKRFKCSFCDRVFDVCKAYSGHCASCPGIKAAAAKKRKNSSSQNQPTEKKKERGARQDRPSKRPRKGKDPENGSASKSSLEHVEVDSNGNWSCHSCTYKNRYRAVKCEMCGTPRG